jgi:hypothetical protein
MPCGYNILQNEKFKWMYLLLQEIYDFIKTNQIHIINV